MHGVLAICEGISGSTRVTGIIVPPLIFALWGALLFLAFRRVRVEDKLLIGAVFAVAGAIGAVIFLFPHGLSGNGDYLARFLISVVVSASIGAAVASLRRDIGLRMIGVAVLGDVSVPGLLVLLFVWSLSLSGGCIG